MTERHDAPPAVRAQLLAAEHWSLLATRNAAQGELLSRITTFLMLVSSCIVSLALIGQFTRFDSRFIAFALVLVGALVVIGTLTQMRVGNASVEDLAHVIGMNRLRAGYADIDPAIARYLATSIHDDAEGIWQTYNHLAPRGHVSSLLASSGSFITFVTSGLAAAFAALAAAALAEPSWLVGAVAGAAAIAYLIGSLVLGVRKFQRITRSVEFPRPAVAG